MPPRNPTAATVAGCVQPEGFCLMLYRAENGEEEWIWNSRDAVTPFGIVLRSGVEARHVEWNRDRFDPWHEPKIGDRIFVNMTLDKALASRRKYVEEGWTRGNPGETMSDRWPSKEAAIAELAAEDVKSFGVGTTPTLAVVDEWLLADLKSRRLPRPSRAPFGSGRFA